MPIITVLGLPQMEDVQLNELHQAIVKTVLGVAALGLSSERDVTTNFVKDCRGPGTGEMIVVMVEGLFTKPARTPEVRRRLARSLGLEVRAQFPNAFIESLIHTFQFDQGFWSSDMADDSAPVPVATSIPPISLSEGKTRSSRYEYLAPAELSPNERVRMMTACEKGCNDPSQLLLRHLLDVHGNYPTPKSELTKAMGYNEDISLNTEEHAINNILRHAGLNLRLEWSWSAGIDVQDRVMLYQLWRVRRR